MLTGKKILLGITGGIAAYKCCSLTRLLVKAGAEVKIIMTPSALQFVSPVTLSVLSKNEVKIDLFPTASKISGEEKADVKTEHVDLGLWADLFVIAPATANTIAKITNGLCDNLLLAALFSSRCDVLIAPAMDDDMYKHQAIKENIAALDKLNYKTIGPEPGELASGLTGCGRMSEPEAIYEKICSIFNLKRDFSGKKVLITAGPTREYIDAIRFITNGSTGKMGFALAKAARERGAEVTLVAGPSALIAPAGINRINVETAEQMKESIDKSISKADVVIMSAAVEDIKPLITESNKIKKESLSKEFSLKFTHTQDILKSLGESKNGYVLVGFALETEDSSANAVKKLVEKNLDIIVLNKANQEGAGMGTDTNIITIIDRKSETALPKMSKDDAAHKILDKIASMN